MGIAAVLGAIGLLIYLSREKSQETTFIAFQNELLSAGVVAHLEIVNKELVRVYLRGSTGVCFNILNYLILSIIISSSTYHTF